EVLESLFPVRAQPVAELLGELLELFGLLAALLHLLLLLFERLGDVRRAALLGGLGRFLQRLLGALSVGLFELVGELFHLVVEADEIAIAEGLLGLLQVGVLAELAQRRLHAGALLALAEREALGGDRVAELGDIGLRLALLHALAE